MNNNVTLVTFGDAIKALKLGRKVHRNCWDKGVVLEYVPETEDTLETIAVTLWTGRRVIGWNNTTEDLFAEDWVID